MVLALGRRRCGQSTKAAPIDGLVADEARVDHQLQRDPSGRKRRVPRSIRERRAFRLHDEARCRPDIKRQEAAATTTGPRPGQGKRPSSLCTEASAGGPVGGGGGRTEHDESRVDARTVQ